MKKQIYKTLTLILITLNFSCNGDPSGKLFWAIFGLPMLGVSYMVGLITLNLFSSNKKENENNVVVSLIVGMIVILIVYSIFKGIMK